MTRIARGRGLRPRDAAVAFFAYFAVVAYLAWDKARVTEGPSFSPVVSQTFYQANLIAGVLVLSGLLVLAATVDRLDRLAWAAARGSAASIRALWRSPPIGGRDSESQEAGPPKGNLSEIIDRLDAISSQSASWPAAKSVPARKLPTLVEEMRSLFVAARRVRLDVAKWKELLSSALAASDEDDISVHLQLLERGIADLTTELTAHIVDSLEQLVTDLRWGEHAGGYVPATEALALETVALLEEGNYTKAAARLEAAWGSFGGPAALSPSSFGVAAPDSFTPLAGPAIVAVAVVAISAMFLPAVNGLLVTNFQLNTAVIVALSYSWLGLALYALLSAYILRVGEDRRGQKQRKLTPP